LFFTTDEDSGRYFVEIQTPPDLEYARSVIALDGTPLIDPRTVSGFDGGDPTVSGPTGCDPAEWSLALGRPMQHRRVLSDDERAEFLAETMGHRYVQTSRYIRPYSSGEYADPQRDLALLTAASDRYLGGRPWDVVITSKTVEREYLNRGFADPEQGVVRAIDHRGAVRGSNEYASCRSGVILGSAHHGDHELRRRAAWLGEPVEGEGKGVERTYGDVGDAVLEQMRELDTAQCALRIGRGKNGRGAIVLLDSAAIPEWIPVVNRNEPADVSKWSKAEVRVRDVVRDVVDGDGGGGGDDREAATRSFRTEDVLSAMGRGGGGRSLPGTLGKYWADTPTGGCSGRNVTPTTVVGGYGSTMGLWGSTTPRPRPSRCRRYRSAPSETTVLLEPIAARTEIRRKRV
jgi:hypothetical protein